MRDVSIVGIGQTKVGEHWDLSVRHLAGQAVLAAVYLEHAHPHLLPFLNDVAGVHEAAFGQF